MKKLLTLILLVLTFNVLAAAQPDASDANVGEQSSNDVCETDDGKREDVKTTVGTSVGSGNTTTTNAD